MEVISDPEVFLDMDVAAEEVVMEDEVGPEVTLQASVDDVSRVHSLDLLSASHLEQLCYPGDSSEDEHGFEEHRLPQSEKDNMSVSCYKDGCLCWECGKCFQSLQMLMQHFRTHKAQVRCNMCRVTFRRMVSLNLHLENVHNNIVLYCTACHLAFKSKWEFNKHLEKHGDFELTPVVLGSLPKSHTSSEISEEIKAELTGLATTVENCETDSFSIPPGENLRNSIQETSLLPALVAKDHAYNNRTDNGTVTTSYALRVRHTKTVTMVFPRESLPESAHQKKVQFFVFRSVDRDQEGIDEGGLDEREEMLQEEEDVKPDPSSLIPPLPDTLSHSGCKSQNSQVKQEDVMSDSIASVWEGAPVEEEDELLDENHSDVGQSVHSQNLDSDSDSPSDASDSSTESVSSGNSSGSSYHPPQRRVRKCNKKVSICSICNACFPDDTALIDHKVRAHPSVKPSRMYVCDSCREVFPQQDIYSSHQCPMKATTKNQAPLSVPASTSISFPDPSSTPTTTSGLNASSWKDITSYPVMTSPLRPAVTTTAMSVNLVTSSNNLVPIPSSNPGSCDVAVREPVRLSVPCPLPNPTVVCPGPLSSGPSLQLPGIMLPSSAPSSQSASMPIMATVVLSGSNAVGRVARVVLQSQGLSFPTPTLTQAVSQKQPIMFSSVPGQVKTVSQTQALPSVQLANLSLRSAIQPHTLIRSSQPPGPAAAPLSRPLTVSVRLPKTAQIPISLPSPAPVSVPLRNPAAVSVTFSNSAPVSAPLRNPAPVSTTFSNSGSGPVPLRNPAPVSAMFSNSAPVSVPLHNPAAVSVTFSNSAPVSAPLRNPAPVSATFSNSASGPVPLRNPTPVSATFSNSAPVSVPLRNPAPVSATFSNSASGPVPLRNPAPVSATFSNSAPVSVPLRNPAPVSAMFSNSALGPVPLRNPAAVSVTFSNSAPVSVPLRNPAPVSATFSNSAPVSVPLHNPAPVSAMFSNSAPVSVPLRNPAPVSATFSNSAPVSVPLRNPAPVSATFSNSAPVSVPLRNPASVSATFSNSAPVSVPLRNPAAVSVTFSNSAPVSVPLRNPAPVSATFSNSALGPVPLRNPALVSATFSNSAPVSVPLRNPAPVSATFPNSVPVSVPLRNPAAVSVTFSNSAPGPVPLPNPAPASLPFSNSAPVTVRLNLLAPAPATIPLAAPIPTQASPGAPEPLKILGLYVNCSQELALQQRLNKSWRSKGVFFCRQCGAISRQPSLGVRHRYLHRGSRQHRCHCGRTFLRRLHLLRHHIQHAEATRFVCAPCGRTFSGARCLARHKQGRVGDRGRKRRRVRKDCQTPFSCDCGQLFQRPTAFLWHKLKNHKSLKLN